MKNSELDQILKSARVPERPPTYWEQFHTRVQAKAHWLQARQKAYEAQPLSGAKALVRRLRLSMAGLGLAGVLMVALAPMVLSTRDHRITDSQVAVAR